MNENFDQEREILQRAATLLKSLYGPFEVDSSQCDRPDAAIIVKGGEGGSSKRIGIEITTVDKAGDLAYFNDVKAGQAEDAARLDAIMAGEQVAPALKKKGSIPWPNTYISNGVAPKAAKFDAYQATGKFDELIVLAFSENLDLAPEERTAYFAEWTSFHLHASAYPFDKVIFVSSSGAVVGAVVYDKARPVTEQPERNEDHEAGIERAQSSILPMGPLNILDMLAGDPTLTPKKRK